jgi:hypothetical protein
MHVSQLIQEWASTARSEEPVMRIALDLPLEHSARLLALHEMYPGRTREQLLLDIIAAALDELEEALPYIQGDKVIAEDEFGDPIYQDVGPTPQFLELTRKHREKLQNRKMSQQ